MSSSVVKNSDIFKETLHRLCEVEANWKPGAVPGLRAASKLLDGNRTLGFESVNSFPCLPYQALQKSLEDAGLGRTGVGRKALLGLDRLTISSFSTECVIDGLAHALQFEAEKHKRAHIRDLAVEIRTKEPLHKNRARAADRALEMLSAAMAINPTATAPYLMARRFDKWDAGEEISAPEVSGKARHDIHQVVYGCVKFTTDKLNKRPPPTELLVVANLSWLFSNWPIMADLYPTAGRPPIKQLRGPRKPVEGSPHRDITAHFLNALFPRTDDVYTSATVKDNFSLPKDAVFCGW